VWSLLCDGGWTMEWGQVKQLRTELRGHVSVHVTERVGDHCEIAITEFPGQGTERSRLANPDGLERTPVR
jgi:hypothetical protein